MDSQELSFVLEYLKPGSCNGVRGLGDLPTHVHPESFSSNHVGLSRKVLREPCLAERITEPRTTPANIIVNALHVPVRKALLETGVVDCLAFVATPAAAECDITPEQSSSGSE